MKLFFTLLLSLNGVLYATESMNTIYLKIEGQQYDDLHLHLVLSGDQRKSIKGYSADGKNWVFSYPDSLYDYIRHSMFYIPGVPDSVLHSIAFNLALQGDTIGAGNYFFGRPASLVRARYVGTMINPNLPMMRRGTTDDFIFGTHISNRFEISTDDRNLVSSIKQLHYGHGFYRPELTYEEMIQRDMDFVRQFPNCRSMISTLSSNMDLYRSKADIAKLFNLFSEELQQSFFGQRIYRHITREMTFINQKLPVWDTGLLEEIVQDSSKFNLILFSASWCGPCIRQIPILKEIYQNLGEKLIMTYVSLDHERTVENWREKMRTHQIPWRSLMVLTQEKDRAISDDYAVFGIPTAILVHPHSMRKEVVNLWVEEHRHRLYELVTKQ